MGVIFQTEEAFFINRIDDNAKITLGIWVGLSRAALDVGTVDDTDRVKFHGQGLAAALEFVL